MCAEKEEENKNQDAKSTEDAEDTELKEQLDTLANFITDTIPETNNDNISPEYFDNLGSGLSRLLKLNPTVEDVPVIKNKINEIKSTSSNINCQIKRK